GCWVLRRPFAQRTQALRVRIRQTQSAEAGGGVPGGYPNGVPSQGIALLVETPPTPPVSCVEWCAMVWRPGFVSLPSTRSPVRPRSPARNLLKSRRGENGFRLMVTGRNPFLRMRLAPSWLRRGAAPEAAQPGVADLGAAR